MIRYEQLLLFVVLVGCNQNISNHSIHKHEINLAESIYNISSSVKYNEIILLQSDTAFWGFDHEEKDVQVLESNLQKIGSFHVSLDTLFILFKNDTLHQVKSIENNELLIEEKPSQFYHSTSFPSFNIKGFYITSCCRGEFGGSIFIQDKETSKIYSTESTCLINIDTYENELYIFNYLPHLATFYSIDKIGDIKSLYEVNFDQECNWYYSLYTNDYDNHVFVDSVLAGNVEKNHLVFDTIGMSYLHGYIDEGEIRLLSFNQNELYLLSVLSINEVEVLSKLIEFEKDQKVDIRIRVFKDNITLCISLLEEDVQAPFSRKLSHVVNIDRKIRVIDIYEFI